eukprot:6173780-Pleurochrysis_carterae.AAC.1
MTNCVEQRAKELKAMANERKKLKTEADLARASRGREVDDREAREGVGRQVCRYCCDPDKGRGGVACGDGCRAGACHVQRQRRHSAAYGRAGRSESHESFRRGGKTLRPQRGGICSALRRRAACRTQPRHG